MPFRIGAQCEIHSSATIDVRDGYLGDGAIVREGARIEGTRVEIGREAFIDRGASIGGGSCFDPNAFLRAGDWLHMGVTSHINTARGVTVGHEFGCGIETKVFTHGAYIDSVNLSAPVQWAPVSIGNNVWLPNAWVNPGVAIGDNVVVAARSLVTRDIPSGALAAGIPAIVLKTDVYGKPRLGPPFAALLSQILAQAELRFKAQPHGSGHWPDITVEDPLIILNSGATKIDVRAKQMTGAASPAAVLIKDQLRRSGVRFRFKVVDGLWKAWGSGPVER